MRTRCPRCGSEDEIAGGKTSDPTGRDRPAMYEYLCGACGLFESRGADAPDFQSFYRRWHGAGADVD